MVIGWRTRYTLISFQKLSHSRFIFLPHLPLSQPLPLDTHRFIHSSVNPSLPERESSYCPTWTTLGLFHLHFLFFFFHFFFVASHRVRHPIFFYNPSIQPTPSKAPGGPMKLLHILCSPSQPDLIKLKTTTKGQKAKGQKAKGQRAKGKVREPN